MMADTLAQWRSLGPDADLWVFGYASLVWNAPYFLRVLGTYPQGV